MTHEYTNSMTKSYDSEENIDFSTIYGYFKIVEQNEEVFNEM